MAVDTRNKRASCISFDLSAGRVWPDPDGTLNQADRQHVALKYPGILAVGPPAPSTAGDPSIYVKYRSGILGGGNIQLG
jgi:hypothetical protein